MQDAYKCERSKFSIYQCFMLVMFKYIINVLIFISLFVLILLEECNFCPLQFFLCII